VLATLANRGLLGSTGRLARSEVPDDRPSQRGASTSAFRMIGGSL